ncbi:MAG: ABC transporter ATP-binding protein/permease [Lactobacillaceae bacterium]|jgi:ATP-binding cassette subfamily B protein|nr:ABC transporter ATP-binding protein/permease [Lactobacillaceae bacterium]
MFRIGRKYLQPGAVILAVLFLVVQVAADLSLPTITSDIINNGIAKQDLTYIWHMGGIMLAVAIAGITGAVINVYFASTQSQRLGMKLRSALFEKVTDMDVSAVDKFGNATLITRTTNDVTQLQNVFQTALRMMLMSPIMLVGAMIMSVKLDGRLMLVFAFALPLLGIAVLINMLISIPRFKVMQTKVDKINLIFQQGLTGVRVIRAFNRDAYETDKFSAANRDLTHTARIVFTTVAMMMPIMTVILSFTNVGIIWFGAKLIGQGVMPVGNLVAFLTYATQILMSFVQLSMVIVLIPRAQASADRINAVMDEKTGINDADQTIAIPTAPISLAFDHVGYRFGDAKRMALQDVSFTATAGSTLAIVGGTGSGKSTFVNLIPRLVDASEGTIYINGVDAKQVSQHDLHADIAITQQKAVLFTGTVRSNLLFGEPDATDDQLWEALEIAQAADFVREQGGLDMEVQQDGANFSGGQRQRLAIARTLIKQANVYVFDDSFSALDFATDARLRTAINQSPRFKDAIKVIIAQRVSTVMEADQILVVDNGRMVGLGDHRTLAKNCPAYQEIVESQLSAADLKEVGLHA